MAIVGDAYILVHAITNNFKKDVQKAFGELGSVADGAGQQIGSAFSNGASQGFMGASAEADRVYQSINALIEKSYYLQAAIGAVVPIIGSLAAGLFALGAQAASAAPALVVLPSLISALGQAALTAKLAFGGLGQAIGKLLKQQSGGGGGVDKMPTLLQGVSSAQERLHNANNRLEKSQKRLNEVYKEAAERIQQLKFDAEGAAISEKKAGLELQKARETLARVQDLPPNSRARKEAELAFQEADLNYRRAVDRNKDLRAEVKETTKDGTRSADEEVKNSKEYLAALDDQKEALHDKQRAKDALAIAEKKLTDYESGKGKGGGGADPLAGLTDIQKKFAKFIASLKPEFDALKNAAGQDLFPKLETAIKNLVQNLFPTLKQILKETGSAVGDTAIQFSKIITEADNLKNLKTVADTNKDSIGKLGTVVGNLASSFLSLLAAADPLIRRFTDWIVKLTEGWKESLEVKNKTGELTNIFNQAGDVAAQFGRILGNIGRAFMDMGRAAAGPGSGGQMIFDSFEKSTKKFEDFVTRISENGKLEEYFRKTSNSFLKILEIVTKIGKAFLQTADDEGASSTLDGISKAVDILSEALGRITGDNGFGKFIEQFATFISHMTESGSVRMYFKMLNTALGLLNSLMSNKYVAQIFVYAAAFHGMRQGLTRVAKSIKEVGLYIQGDLQAIGRFANKVQDVGKVVGGGLKTLGGAIKKSAAYQWIATAATDAWASANTVLTASMAGIPVYAIILAIIALIAIIVVLYKKFKWFRDFVHAVWDGIKKAAEVAWNGIKAVAEPVWNAIKIAAEVAWGAISKAVSVAWGIIKAIGSGIASFFSGIWNGIKTAWDAIWPAMVIVLKIAIGLMMLPFLMMIGSMILAWKTVKVAFDLVWPLISGAIQLAWDSVIKPIFEAFGTVFALAWDAIKLAFEVVWAILKTEIEIGWAAIKIIFEAFGIVFDAAWTVIKTAFNLVWGLIKFEIDFYWNKLIKPIFEAFGTVFKAAWGAIKAAFDLVWPVIRAAIEAGWKIIKPIFEAFGTVFSAVWDGIKKAFESAWNAITKTVDTAKTVFGKIGDAIISAFKSAINFVIRGWNAIEFTVPSVKVLGRTIIPGFTVGLPDIPELAEGGVVRPIPGGVLTRVAEAGRPERIEPLDENGLSKRDKAMIKLLSGNAGGGINITVNPSPGMDEVELASLVSRQLALQLRRGAA